MPIPPPPPAQIFPTWSDVITEAEFRLGQTKLPSLFPYKANILDATQASTQQACKNAWRKLQINMRDSATKKFQSAVQIPNLPVVADQDPASECWLSWFGCSDGVDTFTTPALPDDLLIPLWMSERATGTGLPFAGPNQPNMNPRPDGIPKRNKLIFNGVWQWRADAIWIPGATQSVDLWIYYRSRLPDPVDVGNQRWFQTTANIIDCQDALSWWIVREFSAAFSAFAAAHGETAAAQSAQSAAIYAGAEAMDATKKIANQDVMLDQRADVRRIPYGGGGGSGSGRGRGGGWL